MSAAGLILAIPALLGTFAVSVLEYLRHVAESPITTNILLFWIVRLLGKPADPQEAKKETYQWEQRAGHYQTARDSAHYLQVCAERLAMLEAYLARLVRKSG